MTNAFVPDVESFLNTNEGRSFAKQLRQLSIEYDEANYRGENMTCEFSTGPTNLAEKKKLSKEIEPETGHWSMQVCETCIRHYGNDAPIHVEIVSDN